MYNDLIQEDILTLDNEFFKINTMFETVYKIYDIRFKELKYNYVYTETIDDAYMDLYTEAQNDKNEKEQGLLGRLFTAILNFIRKIRAKILRLFGNDKKATELEAKIKGNSKLANQTVKITNTTDAEKAIDEGTSFFGGLIDKIVNGTATEADADVAEEKSKSLLGRIGIFAGGALLATGGAKVASDKLYITEKLSNLFKKEEDTKKKAAKVTQENEQNVQKGDHSLKNNSQSGNEENTKAGRRIMGSFKGFITSTGKFFTGKASEIRSKINSVSSNDDNGKLQNEQQTTTTQEQSKTKPEETNKNKQQTTTTQEQSKTKPEETNKNKQQTTTTQEQSKTKPEETNDKTKSENKVKKRSETSTTDNKDEQPTPTSREQEQKNDKYEEQISAVHFRGIYGSYADIVGLLNNNNTNQLDPNPIFSKQDFDDIKKLYQIIKTGKQYVTYDDNNKETIESRVKASNDMYKIFLKYKNIDANNQKYKEIILKWEGGWEPYLKIFMEKKEEKFKLLEEDIDRLNYEFNYIKNNSSKTTNESSYDLINDILTIFENSFK